MTRIVIGTVGYVALFAAFVLLPAPSPVSWRAWVLLAVLLVMRLGGSAAVYQVNPALLRERERPPLQRGQPVTDRVLLISIMASFALLVSLASLDGLRLHLLGIVPSAIAAGGMLLFIGGWTLVAYALRSNAFALSVVRAQENQVVVTNGAYRYIRHPMYLGVVAVMLGTSLWLQSFLAVLCSAIPTALLAGRILLEERFITSHTSGYSDYCARVPFRLVPFVW